MHTSAVRPEASNLSSSLKEVWSVISPGADNVTFNTQQAVGILKRGISSRVINPLASYLSLGKGELVEILDLDRTTAVRRANKDQLLPRHSAEGVLRVLEMKNLAMDVFESEDAALTWMRSSHPLLDGQSPVEAAATSFGSRAVKDILVAIQYGGVV